MQHPKGICEEVVPFERADLKNVTKVKISSGMTVILHRTQGRSRRHCRYDHRWGGGLSRKRCCAVPPMRPKNSVFWKVIVPFSSSRYVVMERKRIRCWHEKIVKREGANASHP